MVSVIIEVSRSIVDCRAKFRRTMLLGNPTVRPIARIATGPATDLVMAQPDRSAQPGQLASTRSAPPTSAPPSSPGQTASPRRFNITPRRVAWDLEAVEAWLAQRRQKTLAGRPKLRNSLQVLTSVSTGCAP